MNFPSEVEKLITMAVTARDSAKEAYSQSIVHNLSPMTNTTVGKLTLDNLTELELHIQKLKQGIQSNPNFPY